jgi:PASTA domain
MPVNRRAVIIGVVVIGGGLAGYEIYKYEKNKQATAQASTAVAAASGYGYGTQNPYGYGASAGYGYGYNSPYGYGASGGFPAGYYGYGTPTPPGGTGTTPPIASTTNAQWDQAAVSQLGQDGWDAQTVATALGAYLNGQEVNASQVTVVDAAIGVEGYPPVAGASGYPPAIKTGGTTGGGQGGGGTPVPNVVGERKVTAVAKLKAAGFAYTYTPKVVIGGPEMLVTSQSPAAGTSVNPGSTVHLVLQKK